MDRAREQLLADAALAADQDRIIVGAMLCTTATARSWPGARHQAESKRAAIERVVLRERRESDALTAALPVRLVARERSIVSIHCLRSRRASAPRFPELLAAERLLVDSARCQPDLAGPGQRLASS